MSNSKRIPSSILVSDYPEVRNYKVSAKNNELIAQCDFEPGDVILMLPSLVAGPGRDKAPVCLGCLKANGQVKYIPNPESFFGFDTQTVTLSECSACSWPICSKECQESESHKTECHVLSKSGFKWEGGSDLSTKTSKLDFIAPLKLLLKVKDNSKLKDLMLKIDTKNVERRKRNDTKYGSGSDAQVIQTIRDKCKLEEFSDSDIESAMGLFELYPNLLDCGAVSIHEDTPLITHSCSPNSYYIALSNNSVLYRASCPIKAGEPITASKGSIDQCNLFRRRNLLKDYLLDCQCPRCSDGSEFGTGYGGIACPKCSASGAGVLNSMDSRNEDADWICENCKSKKSGKECIAIMEELKTKMEQAQADFKVGTVEFYDSILQGEGTWSQCPPKSQFVAEAMKGICYIYQYHFQYYQPSVDELRIKARYCQEILSLYSKIFPGFSYNRAMIDYENIVANSTLINEMKNEGYDQSEVDVIIYKVMDLCTEISEMFVLEEDTSMHDAVKQMNSVAVEAKQEQKKRVLISDLY